MKSKYQLPGGILPSKATILQQYLAQTFVSQIQFGQDFLSNFVPNANQLRVNQVIETSTANSPWLHILLYGEPRSGKTWAALHYVFKNSLECPGCHSLIIRKTATELTEAVFRDVDAFIQKWNVPILRRSVGDGVITLANQSSFFFKSDLSLTPGARDDAARRMGGKAYSFAMVEEADTIQEETVRMIPTRLSEDVGKFRKVIFYTMNPPDKNHWTYEFFFQNPRGNPDDPASPIRAIHCPLSGNVENVGKSYQVGIWEEYKDNPALLARYGKGEFAPAVKGDPIFKKSFARAFHVAKESFLKNWNRSLPMYAGWDFGFRGNSCTICQDDIDKGQWRIFYCIFERKVLFEPFLDEVLKQRYRLFPGAEWRDFPDPQGDQHTAMSERSYHDMMVSRDLEPIFDKRRKSVVRGINLIAQELRKQGRAGQPAVLIDPGASYVIDAFESGYCNSKSCLKDDIKPVEDDTYIHVMDSARYPIVMNRDFPLEGDNTVQPFQVIQDGDRIRQNLTNERNYLAFNGPTRQGGWRDGNFSKSRFAR